MVLGAMFFATSTDDRVALDLPDPPASSPPVYEPMVDAGDTVVAFEGEVANLRGTAFDRDGAISLFEWDVDGDGAVDLTNETSGKVAWVYQVAGTYRAVLRAYDNSGYWSEDDVTIRVLPRPPNQPPVARAGDDVIVDEGDLVNFSMVGEDPDGYIVLYEWDFEGDGVWDAQSPETVNITHAFSTPGVHTSVLRVTDDMNASSIDVRVVTVHALPQNVPPTADAGPSKDAIEGTTVILEGSGTDVDGTITLYEWDFEGDGTFDFYSYDSGATTHIYEEAGTYTAVLLVTDDDNASATDTVTVRIYPLHVNEPPTAHAGPENAIDVVKGAEVVFRGTGFDNDGYVVRYEWDFDGDGSFDWTSGTTGATSWVYTQSGLYEAILRVTDDEGATGTDVIHVTVKDPSDPGDFWPSDGKVQIQGLGTFTFDPNEVETVRPDIFIENHFSLFDVLVHLDKQGDIDLEYHFDEALNAHVIDSIDGQENWWYWAYYHGGWQEPNNFRMDHYPYKDKMVISVVREDASRINAIHQVWKEEVERPEANDGKVIIPKVIIRGRTRTLTFTDVEVTAHNLRNDTFQEGVITAIDVIISLHDAGLIDSYKLTWYETIGQSEILNYFVDGINRDIAYGTCGFVYEEGSQKLRYGNHIHIPSDYRILNSPDYEEWFWICL
jgi:hypothetical protein